VSRFSDPGPTSSVAAVACLLPGYYARSPRFPVEPNAEGWPAERPWCERELLLGLTGCLSRERLPAWGGPARGPSRPRPAAPAWARRQPAPAAGPARPPGIGGIPREKAKAQVGERENRSDLGLRAEPPIGIEPMTYALRETATRWTVASTCDNADDNRCSTVPNGGGALQFTPRTTPRRREPAVTDGPARSSPPAEPPRQPSGQRPSDLQHAVQLRAGLGNPRGGRAISKGDTGATSARSPRRGMAFGGQVAPTRSYDTLQRPPARPRRNTDLRTSTAARATAHHGQPKLGSQDRTSRCRFSDRRRSCRMPGQSTRKNLHKNAKAPARLIVPSANMTRLRVDSGSSPGAQDKAQAVNTSIPKTTAARVA
jgi:hypothetical protein